MFYYSVLSFSIEIIYYCLEKRELQELPNFMTSWKVSGLRRVMHIVKVWLLFEACGIFLVSNRNHQAWNVWCLCLMISKDLITSRTSITQTSLNGISEHMWSVTFVKVASLACNMSVSINVSFFNWTALLYQPKDFIQELAIYYLI